MKKFEYLRPETLEEAFSLMVTYGERALYIAGGTDVLVKVKEGRIAPDFLISLKGISGLNEIQYDEAKGELRIGALVTHRTLERSALIRERYPILHDAVSNIGSVQIRNIATIGGNLCNAVPSADGAIPLLALDALLRIRGPREERSVPIVDFFLGPGKTVLQQGEILTEIVIPSFPAHTGSAYHKHGRREAMELAMLGVGVLLSLDEERRRCIRARIALGVAAPTPIRAFEAEKMLEGEAIDEDLLDRAGQVAAERAKVRDSIRGQAWYRRKMIRVLIRRMGLKALERIS